MRSQLPTASTPCVRTLGLLPHTLHYGTMTLCLMLHIAGRALVHCGYTLKFIMIPLLFASCGGRSVPCANGKLPIPKCLSWMPFAYGLRSLKPDNGNTLCNSCARRGKMSRYGPVLDEGCLPRHIYIVFTSLQCVAHGTLSCSQASSGLTECSGANQSSWKTSTFPVYTRDLKANAPPGPFFPSYTGIRCGCLSRHAALPLHAADFQLAVDQCKSCLHSLVVPAALAIPHGCLSTKGATHGSCSST